ncbi:hypothetical protein N7448_010111 [Penicillium atrosanguineum]|uniref:MARVEL domain-containing protein n=1 Tax=Penicillium atrosanguineum TaxID=1132637 RepID=A0A9W9GGU1_9EURO|nr:hypothetical protein N7526_010039 [Penicillium atrosanguineum]KAJ5119442.1 hypothetical protein N7448_010111 [Penicillium atrosanguineum]KAJ5299207.1 hypothetical protein N7476_010764 [Penicillium atrosanguineum]
MKICYRYCPIGSGKVCHGLKVRLTLIILQLLFSVVVLGLSVTPARGQGTGKAPAESGYAAFTGAFGIIAALLGIIALFMYSLDGVITWLIDGVASLTLLAGGIVYAVTLKGVHCSNAWTTYQNKLIDGGSWSDNKGDTISYWDESHLHSRCVSAEANTTFMFLACIACIGTLVASVFSGRR